MVIAALIEDWPTATVVLALIATSAKLLTDALGMAKAKTRPKAPDDSSSSATHATIKSLERRLTRLEGQFDALVHKIMEMLKDG